MDIEKVIEQEFGFFTYSWVFEKLNRFVSLGNYGKSTLIINGGIAKDYYGREEVNIHISKSNFYESIENLENYTNFLRQGYKALLSLNSKEISYLINPNNEFYELTSYLVFLTQVEPYFKSNHFKTSIPLGITHQHRFLDYLRLLGNDSGQQYILQKSELIDDTTLEVIYWDIKENDANQRYIKKFAVGREFKKCLQAGFFLNILSMVIHSKSPVYLRKFPEKLSPHISKEIIDIVNGYQLYPSTI